MDSMLLIYLSIPINYNIPYILSYIGYDYNKVFGANCEIVVGYVPIPLG